MPKPTGDLLKRLGPLTKPFERLNKLNPSRPPRKILEGEQDDFDKFIYDATEDGLPPSVLLTSEMQLSEDCRYLWIINTDGLFVMAEQTPNKKALRKVICHTNITQGSKALQGGEMWYVGGAKVKINFSSGRYGAETIEHRDAVLEYFLLVGYDAEIVW